MRPGDVFDAVVIFGGDGSVHRHLPHLVGSGTPVLVVPIGSGNDFARSLGLSTRKRALAAWERFCAERNNVRDIDVGEITEGGTDASSPRRHFYCCVAGCGVDSATNRRANAMPRWLRSHGGYILGVIGAAMTFRPQRITVTLQALGNSEQISEPALMAAFANAPTYGHGMRIAPRARLDDGLLDVVFVRRTGPLRLLSLFPRVYSASHLDLPEIEYRQAPCLRVETETPLDVYGDGEFICRTPVQIRVRPRGLRVMIP